MVLALKCLYCEIVQKEWAIKGVLVFSLFLMFQKCNKLSSLRLIQSVYSKAHSKKCLLSSLNNLLLQWWVGLGGSR